MVLKNDENIIGAVIMAQQLLECTQFNLH